MATLIRRTLIRTRAPIFVTAHPWFDTVDQSVAWE
jgi:hypothetical protein